MSRIVLFVHHYPPDPTGGTERHVEGLARGLLARGWDVTVVTGTMRGRRSLEQTHDTRDGVRVIRIHRDDLHFERWHRSHHPGVARLVGQLLDDLRPDVAHVHHWIRLTTDLVQVAHAHGVPCVLTLHDYFATCPRISRVLPTGTVCRAVAAPDTCSGCLGAEYPDWTDLQADSLALRRDTLRAEIQAAHRILVLSQTQRDLLAAVQPGVAFEVEPFAASSGLRPSPPPETDRPLRIGTLGRINAEKGQHLLLDAVRELSQPRAVQLHFFGEVDEPAHGRDLQARSSGLDVVWHGRYESELVERTPLHAIALTSTLFETYGLVLDEARMLGVPVLASDTGAYRERVGAGGLLFAKGDRAGLRRVLQRCLDEPELLANLRRGVAPPPPFAEVLDFLERCYADARARAAPLRPVAVSAETRLAHEFQRADRLERLLTERRAPPADAG